MEGKHKRNKLFQREKRVKFVVEFCEFSFTCYQIIGVTKAEGYAAAMLVNINAKFFY